MVRCDAYVDCIGAALGVRGRVTCGLDHETADMPLLPDPWPRSCCSQKGTDVDRSHDAVAAGHGVELAIVIDRASTAAAA